VGKINLGRVVAGGLLAGLVLNIGEAILNTLVVASQVEAAMMALNLPPVDSRAIIGFVILGFALGIAMVWVYAAIRTRFGPGVPTAVVAGVIVWFLAYLYPNAGMSVARVWPNDLLVIVTVWGLAEAVLAAIAGAWMYSEA
jgi:hypothetical protein